MQVDQEGGNRPRDGFASLCVYMFIRNISASASRVLQRFGSYACVHVDRTLSVYYLAALVQVWSGGKHSDRNEQHVRLYTHETTTAHTTLSRASLACYPFVSQRLITSPLETPISTGSGAGSRLLPSFHWIFPTPHSPLPYAYLTQDGAPTTTTYCTVLPPPRDNPQTATRLGPRLQQGLQFRQMVQRSHALGQQH